MSSSIHLALLVVAAFVILQCNAQGPSVVRPNEKERQACEDNATKTNRNLEDAIKDRPQSCKVTCKYDDGTQDEQNSPDGQLCCDMVGVGPTGTCKDGSCPVGMGK